MYISYTQITGTFVTFDKRIETMPGVTTFVFKTQPSVRWVAGQYYVYALFGALLDKRTMVRPFTVSTAPIEGYLSITTRLGEPHSRFKQALLELKPGQKVYAAGPYGTTTMETPDVHAVMLIGGIGVTVARSILTEQAAQGLKSNITVLYANRPGEVLFRAELDALAAKNPNLVIHYLTEPERIDEASIAKYVPGHADATFYISGPKPMVKGVAAMLNGLNIPANRIKADGFKGYK